eukprot:TRINITY_DN5572_c0_g1_i1.p1 TRINITY_DN5572_c0_g1~~TRINITY_DN5572_c0_g1_i1.p1  ORF type:complete len:295 (+),score=94.48 TRINITY_DN5572_c0_g1_i1:466-1350(+)
MIYTSPLLVWCACLLGFMQTLHASETGEPSVTWFEGNSWLWTIGGVTFLVDPIFDTLDFGMPYFYKADKRVFSDYRALTERMAKEAEHIVITQGLPDHCCEKTLPRLAKLMKPTARVIAPPSAKDIVSRFFPDERVTYAKPGDKVVLKGSGGEVELVVMPGSVVGPPWQAPENAYLARPRGATDGGVLYEPHCMWSEDVMRGVRADAIVTPTYGQRMGPEALHYTILNSGERAVELAKTVGARRIISYNNVDQESTGVLNLIVTRTGDAEEFARLAAKAGIEYVQVQPGTRVAL